MFIIILLQIYLFILILPWTRLRDRLTLPSKLINSSTFNAFCINLHAIFCYSKKKFLRLHRYISHARLSTINRSRLLKLYAKSHRIMCRGFYRSGLFNPVYTFGLSYIPVRILWVSYQVQKQSNILEIYVQGQTIKILLQSFTTFDNVLIQGPSGRCNGRRHGVAASSTEFLLVKNRQRLYLSGPYSIYSHALIRFTSVKIIPLKA